MSPPLSTRFLAFAFMRPAVALAVGIALAAGSALEAGTADAELGGGTSLDVLCAKPDGSDPRLIEVVSDAPGRVPCETWYTKWGVRTQKASAANAEGHCEAVAQRMQSNLEAAGFTCDLDAEPGIDAGDALPNVSAAPPTREEAIHAAPRAIVEVASAPIDAAPPAPIADATGSQHEAPDVVAVALVPRERVDARDDATASPFPRDDLRRVTPARLRAHVDAFMTERPGCSADVAGAKYSADGSFAVVRWSCEIAASGYASHLLAIFADGTAPASLRIGGALARNSMLQTIDDAGRIQVQTKLYKSDDPECCPSVVQVDVYRVAKFAESNSIERLAD